MRSLSIQKIPDPEFCPDDWVRIYSVDAHTEGEPLRVIISGYPIPDGVTILERRRRALADLDHFRTGLMWEPRGHADMYGCLIVPAEHPDSDFGVLFLHNEGYSSMCGHGVLAVTKVVLALGLFEVSEPETILRIDTPAGTVVATARIEGGSVKTVSFQNVPSFVTHLDLVVDVPEYGPITCDVAFGGAFYAYVDARLVGLKILPENTGRLVEAGMAIKQAVQRSNPPKHPTDADLSFLYGTIFYDAPEEPEHFSRNVCVFADGEVDRSPTGTGVSGRAAIALVKGEIQSGETVTIESLIGSTFTVRIVKTTTFAGFDAIIPEVSGRVFLTGRHEFIFDPADPMKDGFLLR